jgi:hypothetical protein
MVLNTASPGFLMGGFRLSSASGLPNFYIDRTDKNGVFTGSPSEFQREYVVTDDVNCLTGFSQRNNCIGVTVITSQAVGTPYAVVGGNNLGFFFAELASNGTVSNDLIFKYPGGIKTSYSKPLIIESATAGRYFVVGSFDGDIYTVLFDGAGTVYGNYTLHDANFTLEARDVIISPYNGNLTIVGHADSGSNIDGFFYQIDNTLTTVTTLKTYDRGTIAARENFFNSIEVAASTTGGNGFIVGGYSNHASTGNGTAWMLKLTQNGTVSWASQITGNIVINNGKIYDVLERLNSNNAYEYYGTSASASGIALYKLDASGAAFHTSNPGTTDESVYNSGSSHFTWPVDMTFVAVGGSQDVGIHIFGNMDNTGPGNHYLVEAYFSGHAGCNTPNTISSVDTGTPTVNSQSPTAGSNMAVCTGVITSATTSGYSAECGPVSSIAGGSNNKTVSIENRFLAETNIFPIPASDYLIIDPNVVLQSDDTIEIIDLLGQKMKYEIEVHGNEYYKVSLDKNCVPGTYILNFKSKSSFKSKVIIIE